MSRFNLTKTAVLFSVALASMTAASGASAQQYIAEELLDQPVEQGTEMNARNHDTATDAVTPATGKAFNPAYAAAITDTIV